MRPSDDVRDVTMVIPARNAAATIGDCLDAAIAVRERDRSRLAEILLVDDGSVDDTAAIAGSRGVRVLAGSGRGPGCARNIGWRAATTPLIWFLDSDCVPASDALERLVPHLSEERVGAAGGTYAIAPDRTLLERLIHEEIMVRHARMGSETEHLATFNVVYRRSVLEEVGGFDERFLKGQDAELGFRAIAAGWTLRFDRSSAVRHFHADRLRRYLSVQRQQAYWRVALHAKHPRQVRGNSYSGLSDHAQPFIAAALPLSLAALPLPLGWAAPTALAGGLLLAQVPMARAMAAQAGTDMWAFVGLGFVRALWRAAGLLHGVADLARGAAGARSGSGRA